MEDDLKCKTTSNSEIEISQKLLVGSSPNYRLYLMHRIVFIDQENLIHIKGFLQNSLSF